MKWLVKKRREILARWKNNQVSLRDTVHALWDTGLSPEQAWNLVERL